MNGLSWEVIYMSWFHRMLKCLAGNKCVDLVRCPLQYCELCPNSGGIYKETDASRYATTETVVLEVFK